jgi:hypothetical protein
VIFFFGGQILSFLTKEFVNFWDFFSVLIQQILLKIRQVFYITKLKEKKPMFRTNVFVLVNFHILVTQNCGGVNDAKDFLLEKKKWAQIATLQEKSF